MPVYEAASFDPPAPIARVLLRNPDNQGATAEVLVILDSGADITLVPRAAIERLGIAMVDGESHELIGFDGSRSSSPVVFADLIFLNRVFRGRFLLVGQDRGIVGRDILNHVCRLLDGPARHWSEYIT